MLELKALTKYYNRLKVVDGVSFKLIPGQITGYLGPNGAGKSTTVKIMAGLIKAEEGHVLYNGVDINDLGVDYKKLIGYVPEQSCLYEYLTGFEFLQFVGSLRGIPEYIIKRRSEVLMKQMGMEIDGHLMVSNYSKGMKQKVLLGSALLQDPDILIFDEPLSGLDITTTMVIKEVLKGMAKRGKIIIYSSHIMEVVENLCERVIVLNKGEVVAEDSVRNLKKLKNNSSLEHIFRELVEEVDSKSKGNKILEALKLM